MSNKLKRKAKKKTVDFGEYTISLPSGTMLESFIKYTAEEPWNIDRVTDFLDAHSARVRKKVEKNQSFSQQEMDEMYEFSIRYPKSNQRAKTFPMFLRLCAENDRGRRIPPWAGKIL